MARKASDSPELKAAIDAFSALSVEDQSLFRSKIFASLCNGLSKEQRVAFFLQLNSKKFWQLVRRNKDFTEAL